MNIKEIKKNIEYSNLIAEEKNAPLYVKLTYKDGFITCPKIFKVMVWGRETKIYICFNSVQGVAFIKNNKRHFVSYETFINSYYKYKS